MLRGIEDRLRNCGAGRWIEWEEVAVGTERYRELVRMSQVCDARLERGERGGPCLPLSDTFGLWRRCQCRYERKLLRIETVLIGSEGLDAKL